MKVEQVHVDRFWAKVDKSGECWIWTAGRMGDGYGGYGIRGTGIGAHRFAWIAANGEIPPGLEIDHLCHNRLCVNVKHMRLATRAQNAQNLAGAHRDSKSGVRGVDWFEPAKRWRVRVRANRKDYFGGYFTCLSEATAKAEQMRHELQPMNIG